MPKPPRNRNRKKSGNSDNTLDVQLGEARTRKKSAERNETGGESLADLRSAIDLFNAVIQNSSGPERIEYLFELAETCQLLVEVILAQSDSCGSPLTRSEVQNLSLAKELQLKMHKEAESFAKRAHEAYEAIVSGEAEESLRQAAFINSTNSLLSLSDILSFLEEAGSRGDPPSSVEILSQAAERYERALSSSPGDNEVLTNLADCWVKLAEKISQEEAQWERVSQLYQKAMTAYETACSNSDEKSGGDLPGLLHNWGLGLLSLAQRVPNAEEELRLLSKAVEKLRNACEFRRTDADQRMALGEALCLHAERAAAHSRPASESIELLQAALSEAYAPILQFDSWHVDGRLGLADAELAMGKVLAREGRLEEAVSHWNQSALAYRRALDTVETGSGSSGVSVSFEDQCDALYNLACVSALLGAEQECCQVLRRLREAGALSPSDLSADDDFEPVRNQEWFVSLLQ